MATAAKALDFADVDDSAILAAIATAPIKAQLPTGYSYNKDGLYYDDGGDAGALRIAGKIEVLAQTRDDSGSSWGRLLGWYDDDGREHRWAMPMSMLAGDGNDIRATLLDRGCSLSTVPKAKGKLLDFLATTSIQTRALAVDRVGWANGAFALPDRTIGDTPGQRVMYQGPAAFDHAYRVNGDLAEWQQSVARFGIGNSRVAVALSAAFVGPLLDILGEEGGGINFRGDSSTGKTTALHAAASVWGRPEKFVRQWRATSNGLEGVAVQHNETLLCLDELAQLDAKEAGSVAYMLANGQGKTRASRGGAARSAASWRVMFLSSGEISLGDLAGRDSRGARRSAAGQEVRILDIAADAECGHGLFEDLHGAANGETLSRLIKDGAAATYGIAGPAFVEKVAETPDQLRIALKAGVEQFVRNNVAADAAGQVQRAARRFGMIAAAGEVATRLGILPWPPGEAFEAAARLYKAWLAGRGGTARSEDLEAISKVRAFLEQHGSSRFEPMQTDPAYVSKVINRVGFWELVDGQREHLILPEAWKEVCAGLNSRSVARLLAERGVLAKDSDGKLSVPRKLPGMKKVRCYVVRASIFSEGIDD